MKQKLRGETALSSRAREAQSGRSMVEMLGVLAIIGVLSIGGIAGYTNAMDQYRANEIVDAIQKRMIVASTECLSQKKSYGFVSLAEFPQKILGDMVRFDTRAYCNTDGCGDRYIRLQWYIDSAFSRGLCYALQRSPIAQATQCCGGGMEMSLFETDCSTAELLGGCQTTFYLDLTPYDVFAPRCGDACSL